MNRERAKELLPIIQAFADGKEIEFCNNNGPWELFEECDNFTGHLCNAWRIKPEPREFWLNTMTSAIVDYEYPSVLLEPRKAQKGWIRVREVIE